MAWDSVTGRYVHAALTWQEEPETEDWPDGEIETSLPCNLPDQWLSRSGGPYLIGMSFHYPPHAFPSGSGMIDGTFSFRASPFLLNHSQDSYNSWNVSAST